MRSEECGYSFARRRLLHYTSVPKHREQRGDDHEERPGGGEEGGQLGFFRFHYENRAAGSRIHRSFPLIAPSITALFIAIQFSLPLSLGLVGALTIIRFRTPIKEPEEVAFIMLIIAASIVCATFQYLLLAALFVFAVVALIAQKYIPRLFISKRQDGVLLLAIDGEVSSALSERIMWILEQRLSKCRAQSLSFSDPVTTLHYSFTGLNIANVDGLVGELNELVNVRKLNVYFNGQGVLS